VILAYRRSFLNVVTNYLNIPSGYIFPNNSVFNSAQPLTQGAVTVITTNISTTASTDPYGLPGSTSLQTNITTQTMLTNMVMGDFFIVPTNSCGYVLLSNVLTRVIYITNTVFATNVTTTTGASTNAATNFAFTSYTYITSWTNHNLAYFPIDCVTNVTMLRRGVEKITFLRRDFDSLLGQFFYPQTNLLALTTVTNSRDVIQYVQRVTTAPDFLFTAADLVPGPAATPARYFISRRSINFNQANALAGLAGPGTIEPGTTITFNKSGPIFFNTAPTNNTPWSLDDLTKSQLDMWGSFDDSTNAPTVYPNGTSIVNLENQLLIQLVPTVLPTGQVGVQYSSFFSGGGGQPPYNFTLAPNSAGLPPGLVLSFDGSGLVAGTPSLDGIFDFTVRMTDSNGRYADWQVTVTINP
jgi:hypothetical protein